MSSEGVQSEYTDVEGNDKDIDEKNIDDKEFLDSGFISEPNLRCEQDADYVEDSRLQMESHEMNKEQRAKVVEEGHLDSGVDLTARVAEEVHFDSGVGLSDNFSILSLDSDRTAAKPAASTPTVVVVKPETETPQGTTRLPFWQFLFQQDEDGDNKLHLCALHGSVSGVRAIIAVCPHRALLDVRNDDGFSPLHMAVLEAHASVVSILVDAKANVCVRDCNGNTPLHLAVLAGEVECLRALIGVRNAHNLADALEQKNYEGETCVYLAARAGNVDILRVLVQFGADINSREGKAGYTALHVAAERGDRVLASFLIDECPTIDPYTRNYAGRTALKLAGPKLCRALALRRRDDDSDTSDDSDDSEDANSDDEMKFGSTKTYNPLRGGVETINVA